MEELFSLVMNNYDIHEYLNFNSINNSPETSVKYNNGWKYSKMLSTEEDYVKNYANTCCSVTHNRYIVKLVKDGGKISLKVFAYNKRRRVGKKFFSKRTNVYFITYNYETNSLYKGQISNYHKKRGAKKTIRKNAIFDHPFNYFRSLLRSVLEISKDVLVNKDDIINKVFNLFCDNIPGTEKYGDLPVDMKIYRRFYDYGGVKLPDNWESFIFVYPQPNKVLLKKNKFKYVDSLMSLFGLTGDKIRRILHSVKKFNVDFISFAFELFGKDFILSKPDDDIIKMFESKLLPNEYMMINFTSNKEKNNIYEIFKLVAEDEISFYTFLDHIRFLRFLRPLEGVKWTSRTYDEFNEEHYLWSEKQGFYTKGDFNRIYNDEFIINVEKPINFDDKLYYPVVLTKSQDYNKESYIQSNCVKTYVDKAQSLIISLRDGSVDSEERATIEYQITKYVDENRYRFYRIQSLGRFNHNLSDEWLKVIDMLDKRMSGDDVVSSFTLPKLKVIIGNNIIESDSSFKVTDNKFLFNLQWDKDVSNNNIVNYDIIDRFDDDLNI